MNNWNRMFKPIVVLGLICVIVTGALAATNSVTAPIIEEATRLAQETARQELLPEAEGFEKIDGIDVANVSDVYAATNGVGYVVTSSSKGYGGTMTVMVSFTPEGTIKQIKVTEQAETQGIGSNVANNAAYWANYAGKDGTAPLALGTDVDAYAGATISSRALNNAVNSAIAAYNAIP